MDGSPGSSVGLLNRIERINIEKIFSMLCRWVSLGITVTSALYAGGWITRTIIVMRTSTTSDTTTAYAWPTPFSATGA